MSTNRKTIARTERVTTPSTRYLEIAQTLAAYVAIPVVLVYPFGFFALFVQFMRYFFLDLYSAWYAASLVNRMVAIGQGAAVLIFALVASVVLSAMIAQTLLRHEESRNFSRLSRFTLRRPSLLKDLSSLITRPSAAFTLRRFDRRRALFAKLVALSLLTLALYVSASRILAGGRISLFAIRGRRSTECAETESAMAKIRWHQLDLWPDSLFPALIFLAGCTIGGWVIYGSHRSYHRSLDADKRRPLSRDYRLRPGFFARGVTEGWIRSGLAIAYVSSVVASIVLAWYTPAYLPYVTYGDTIEYRGAKEPTNKAFLSHTDGHWYFLHRLENDNDEHPREWIRPDFKIVSLAEGQVDHVRVRPNPPRASRVAPLPFGFGVPPLDLSRDPCEPKKDS